MNLKYVVWMMHGLEGINMQYNYISTFPSGIDSLVFFHDVDLKNLPIMEAYNNMISSNRFTDANIFISQQNDIHNYSADLFNYIENMIFNWHKCILEKEKYNPHRYSSIEPETISLNEVWIDG